MAFSITFHGTRAKEKYGIKVDVLCGQEGDSITVEEGEASAALTQEGYYRVCNMSAAAALLRAGAGVTTHANGEYWPAGNVEVRRYSVGDVIAVGPVA